MSYDDYYARQVVGAWSYFSGARVHRGHGFGSVFSGFLRSVAPLIRRGAVALRKRALRTETQIAGDVVAGQNVKRLQNEGQLLPEEICYKASSTYHHLPENE